jgi:hypothetical protein
VLWGSFESIGILVNQDIKGNFEGLSRGSFFVCSSIDMLLSLPRRRSFLGSEPHFKIRFWIHFLIVMTEMILIP